MRRRKSASSASDTFTRKGRISDLSPFVCTSVIIEVIPFILLEKPTIPSWLAATVAAAAAQNRRRLRSGLSDIGMPPRLTTLDGARSRLASLLGQWLDAKGI